MELLAFILVIAGVLGFSAWREHLMVGERKAMEAERKEMLDRLMSQDFIQFKESQEPFLPPVTENDDEEEEDTSIPLTTRPLTTEELSEVYGSQEKN